MTKKASPKKNGRPHATHPTHAAHATRETKPKRATATAHAKSPAMAHGGRHEAHATDSLVTAAIGAAASLSDGVAKSKKLAGRAKADASNALTRTAPSLLGRIVGLVAGIVDALLPKKLPFRKHAHSH